MQTFYPPLRFTQPPLQLQKGASFSGAAAAVCGAEVRAATPGDTPRTQSLHLPQSQLRQPSEPSRSCGAGAGARQRSSPPLGESLEATWQEQLIDCQADYVRLLSLVEQKHGQFGPLSLATALHRIALAGAHGAQSRFSTLVNHIGDILHKRPEAFKPQSLANMTWAVARLQWPCQRLMDGLALCASSKMERFKAPELSMMLWGFASTSFPSAASRASMLAEVANEVLRRGAAAFDAQSLATIAYAAGVLHLPSSSPLWSLLGEGCQNRVKEFSDRQVANLIWAFATVASSDCGSLMDAVQSQVSIPDLAPIDLSLTAWSMAKLARSEPDFYLRVGAAVQEKETAWDHSDPRNIATLLYSFALVGQASDNGDAFRILGTAASRRATEFAVQGLTNVVWAYATAHHADEALFAKVCAELTCRPNSEFEPLDVANCLWAMATISHRQETKAIEKLRGVAIATLPEFSSQNLSITLWSLAAMEVRDEAFYAHLSDCFVQKMEECSKAQELCNILWATATVTVRLPWLFVKADARASALGLNTFKSHELSILMWAHGMAGVVNKDFFDDCLEEFFIHRGIDTCTPREVANTAWAYSTIVGISHEPWLRAVCSFTLDRIDEFDMQCIGNVVWAFATVAVTSTPLLAAACKEMAARCENISEDALPNISQVLSAVHSAAFVDVSFFDAAAQSILRYEGARELATRELIILGNALLPARRRLRHWAAVERLLRDRVLEPLLEALPRQEIRTRPLGGIGDHLQAFSAFDTAVGRMDLDHLGVFYTAALLLEAQVVSSVAILKDGALEDIGIVGLTLLGQSASLPWVEEAASRCIEKARQICSEGVESLQRAERPQKISRQLDKVNKREIIAWVGYDVSLRGQGDEGERPRHLQEVGRTFCWGEDFEEQGRANASRSAGLAAERFLRPLMTKSRQSATIVGTHDRSGHAERVALLDVASEWLGFAPEGCFPLVEGWLRLYVTHFPCISCLGIISQFARLFPGVRLELGFVDARAARRRIL